MANLFDNKTCFPDVPDYGAYFRSPIPVPTDVEIAAIVREWISLDRDARMTISAGLCERQSDRLLAFSERVASLAVRERNPDHVFVGLVALGVNDWKFDDRENLLVVPLHYDACARIGADPAALLESAAAVLPPRSATGLRAFGHRNERDRSIAAMGYEAGTDEEGFRYKRLW